MVCYIFQSCFNWRVYDCENFLVSLQRHLTVVRAIPIAECLWLPSSHPASACPSLTLLPLPAVRRLLSQRAWDGEGLIRKNQWLSEKNQGCSHLFACSLSLSNSKAMGLEQLPPDLPMSLSGHKAAGKGDMNPFHPLHTPALWEVLTPILSVSALTDTWANFTPLHVPVEN